MLSPNIQQEGEMLAARAQRTKFFICRWLLSLTCARVRKHSVNKALENRFKPLQSDFKENAKQSDEKPFRFSLSQSSYLSLLGLPFRLPLPFYISCFLPSSDSTFKSTSLLMEVLVVPKHINSIRVQVEVI